MWNLTNETREKIMTETEAQTETHKTETQARNRLIIQNNLMVTQGEGGWGMNETGDGNEGHL